MASTNGTDFYGDGTSGNSVGWVDVTLDLSNVTDLGDLTGEPAVWVALIFQSDSSLYLPEGVHVDDILLRKCTTGGCTLSAREPDVPNRLEVIPAQKSFETR